MPKVSIVIPLYNREMYIAATLRSVLDQTFGDFEVLVIDDGSVDRSAAEVRKFDDPRIRYRHQLNSGRPASPRNVAIGQSRGEYIAFIDSDDLWLPTKLAEQVALLDARPDAGMVYSWAVFYDGKRDLGHCGPKRARVPEQIFEALLLQGCFPLIGTVMLRKRVLDRVGTFDERDAYRGVEDYELWLRIARAYPCVFMPVITTRYRLHATNISGDKHQTVRKWRDVIEDTCARFGVAEALRKRALARAYIADFKVGLETGDTRDQARAQLDACLALDPSNRAARLLSVAVERGLHRALQLAYRNRRLGTQLRDQINRLGWSWRRS